MRLQFSLATLFICTTVLAMVCAVCVAVPARDSVSLQVKDRVKIVYGKHAFIRPLTTSEIAQRLAIFGPASVAAALVVLWIGRRATWDGPANRLRTVEVQTSRWG